MNLTEIKSAVDAGKKVFWMNQGYQVKKQGLGYFIECQFENRNVELQKDKETLNGKEEEFFLEKEVPILTAPVLSSPTEIPKNNDEIKDIITKELDLKILVVEDDFAVLHLMLSLLKACNNRVSGASSAEEALNLIELAHQKNEPFQLIYLDINLPKMNGLDFCRTIREEKGNEKTLIVATTTTNNVKTIVNVLKTGADDYLLKPITMAQLAIKTLVCSNTLKKLLKVK